MKTKIIFPITLIGFLTLTLKAVADFKDVSSRHVYSEAIVYVQSKGIVQGYEDQTYRPDQKINRAEFTKILIESQFGKTLTEKCDQSTFRDVPKNQWFTPYICVAESLGIVQGYEDQTYKPDQPIAFVEAAKILVNTFQFETKPDKTWYKPFVEHLSSKKVIPASINQLEQPITRAEMAEMIWRLKEKIATKSSKTLAELQGDFITHRPSGRKISMTSGMKHSVALNDIQSAGPAKDGIPSIDQPEFVNTREAGKYLNEEGWGIAVSFNGTDRFYPHQILTWHEVVNDQIDDQPLLVTYCPLCGISMVYEPIIHHQITEFGTSGKLWNSHLVMYDRQTDSYWSQLLGEAITGEMTGAVLRKLPFEVMKFKDWQKKYPKGEVLSKNTGYIRDYSQNPYEDQQAEKAVFFPLDHESDAYTPKERIFGIEINGRFKAYPLSELKKIKAEFRDTFTGTELKISFDHDSETVEIFTANDLQKIIPLPAFWFAWYAVHPDTEIYKIK